MSTIAVVMALVAWVTIGLAVGVAYGRHVDRGERTRRAVVRETNMGGWGARADRRGAK